MIIISGPCVIENKSQLVKTASYIKEVINNKDIDFFFKSSCIKDNRTTINNYRGVGFEKGIELLLQIKEVFYFKITTDFHNTEQIQQWGKYVDLIQIPAYLAQQTSLIETASKLNKPIHIKKPQFLGPVEMNKIVQKLKDLKFKNKIIVSDRGTMFGYNQTIIDPRHISLMNSDFILTDITHPNKNYFGNSQNNAKILALSSIASGSNGLFLETADNCNEALCDAGTMVNKNTFKEIINESYNLWRFLNDKN